MSTTGGNAGTGGASGTCPAGGWAAGKQTITLEWGGVSRKYVIYIPPGYTGTSPVPLVLVIHGAHNTPSMAESWSQMNPVANQNGFIIAYPAGLDCWNAGGILPGCMAADDDVGFLKALVNDVKSHACIDPKRVYATGISNGSMMAQYMGCQAADIFAAVAGVAAGVGRCSPSRPLSVFYVHGTEDKTVSFSSAQPNVTGWANRDGCNSTPIEAYNVGSTRCVVYQGCKEGAEVEFCTVTGMGHCWPEDTRCGPGGGAAYGVTDFKASPMMWEFFKKHPMP
jgi:polyhydroxybutyrate depolymerase